MRFRPSGPNIPAELIAAQEKGETIFVCGAGVSRTVGLPLFRGLVEGIYRELSEDWRLHPAEREGMQDDGELYGQYDRVLRSLERRLAASDSPRNRGMRGRIRAAVRTVLTPPDIKLENHLELLKLSRDAEGRSRLLTTNFDTLFERAWWDGHQERIASHAGPAMPQPKVDAFTGVLHLHGRLADDRAQLGLAEETALILTSAEFGDAYLRSGWASRYVYDIVRACIVVMVGYQADDPCSKR
jgi:SIR2-like domain